MEIFLFLGATAKPALRDSNCADDVDVTTKTSKYYRRSELSMARLNTKRNAAVILKCWSVSPFRWHRNKFRCSYCDSNFTETDLLRSHVKECSAKHDVSDIYKKFKEMTMINIDVTDAKCRFCDVNFDLNEMKTHVAKHDLLLNPDHPDGVVPFRLDKNSWRCLNCSEFFNNFLNLYSHMNSHYQHYVCDVCGKGFMTGYRLRRHSEVHVSGTFPCDVCGLILPMRSARECHKANVHYKSPRYECPMCLVRFEDYYERMKHLKVEHREKEVTYKCDYCDLVFSTSSKRAAHVKGTHLSLRNDFPCTQCDNRFKSSFRLKSHMRKHGEGNSFRCNVCGKSMAVKASLERHLRMHEKVNFPCKLCGRTFVNNTWLVRHINMCHVKGLG